MRTYTEPLKALREYEECTEALLKKKTPVAVTGCIDSQKCHFVHTLGENYCVRLIVTYNDLKAKEICEDYRLYDPEVVYYPAKDVIFFSADIHGNTLVRERMRVIKKLAEERPVTIVTTVDGGIDHVLPLSYMKENCIRLTETEEVDLTELTAKLSALGYERQGQVEHPGEFAVRGGILDVFSLTEETPFRVEFFGDEIDSIRYFDVTNQRSIDRVEEICIYPATELILSEERKQAGIEKLRAEAAKQVESFRKEMKTEEGARLRRETEELCERISYLEGLAGADHCIRYFYEDTVSFFDYFGEDAIVFLDEPARLAEKGDAVAEEFSQSMTGRLEKGYILPGQADVVFDYKMLLANLGRKNTVLLSALEQKLPYLAPVERFDLTVRSVAGYNNNFELLVKDLAAWKKSGYRVVLLCASRLRAERMAGELRERELSAFYSEDADRVVQPGEILVGSGSVHRGFEYPMIKWALISESDIFGTEHKKKKKRKNYDGQHIGSLSDLSFGDYVVHENHGLGIYRGIEKIEVDRVIKDYVKIEYGDGGNLYVPATGLDVIQKYAAADAAKKPKLNKLNSVEWKNTKTRVKGAVKDLAKDLVELYALRSAKKGFACEEDTVWQKELEDLFPYEETDDQLRAIEEIKKDMESTRIMDRLLCGDVGYGKTEVALRAAFKAVSNGKQVVVLVPTTILAQQHYNTFTQRMMNYPVKIELMSRFRTPAQQKAVIEGFKKGSVDIVIGTHRVLSKDIEPKNLGLLIVDEEQRFGVAHKEKIKQLKGDVDVLTLTATPIPRTLHMSLIGIRDMSILEEPPVDRLPIQTFVLEQNDEMVREAICRELARGGQVYYVYNRVHGIDEVAAGLQKMLPDANVAYAHGQMSERTLEKIMYEFINGEIDVLVSTTIIETGLDISNVNTMIIADADRLGLSQLYQLRGRVGRTNRTAYAFLMYKRDKMLKEIAEKRLQAIKEFTELGSGFKIAMRDLEIRGAGNLLGAEQSGHMEAVGYDLYCKLLNDAVKELKGDTEAEEEFETTVDLEADAYIPESYIRNEVQKLDMYKRIALLQAEEELSELQDELIDRFGDIPQSVNRLLEIALLRNLAHEVYVTQLIWHGAKVRLVLYPKAKLIAQRIPALLKKFNGKLKFSAEGTPEFSYELAASRGKTNLRPDVRAVLKELKELLQAMKEELT